MKCRLTAICSALATVKPMRPSPTLRSKPHLANLATGVTRPHEAFKRNASGHAQVPPNRLTAAHTTHAILRACHTDKRAARSYPLPLTPNQRPPALCATIVAASVPAARIGVTGER